MLHHPVQKTLWILFVNSLTWSTVNEKALTNSSFAFISSIIWGSAAVNDTFLTNFTALALYSLLLNT